MRTTGGVDVATGAFLLREPIGTIPSHVPIAVGWFFNSKDNCAGQLGKGTFLSYDYFIAQSPVLANQRYELIAPGNRHFVFDATPNGNGDYIDTRDPELLGATLHFTSPPSLACELRWKSGIKFVFSSNGALSQVKNRYNLSISITRNAQGFATRITQSTYRAASFVYGASGKLSSVLLQFANTSPVNRTWRFAYDASGRLSTVTNPSGGITTYTWLTYTRSDGQQLPLVQTVTNPRGIDELINDYDASGRVITQTHADGSTLTATYPATIGSDGGVISRNYDRRISRNSGRCVNIGAPALSL